MTDEIKFVHESLSQARSILRAHLGFDPLVEMTDYESTALELKMTEILMNHFPMQPKQEQEPAGPAKPNAPGNWLYKKPGDSGFVGVSVDEKEGVFRYYNRDADRWVPVDLAQGEWGGVWHE